MAAPTYTEIADSLFLTELKGLRAGGIDYVRETSAVLHLIMSRRGKITGQSELKQDEYDLVLYGSKEATTRHMPDESTAGNLSDTVTDPLTRQASTYVSATFNITFVQEQLKQLNPLYIRGQIMSGFSKFYDEQERFLLTGSVGAATIVRNPPYAKDDSWATGIPMSLPALYLSGTNTAGAGGDDSGLVFMGIKVSDVGETKGQPYRKVAGNANGSNLLTDMDQVIARCFWTSEAHGTDWLFDWVTYSKAKQLHVDKAALVNPMMDDLAIPIDSFQYGTTTCTWHRDLAKDIGWDYRGTPEIVNPALLLDAMAYQMRVVMPGSDNSGVADAAGMDWMTEVNPGNFQMHTKTSVFKRMSGTYLVKYAGFRGSLGHITDLNL